MRSVQQLLEEKTPGLLSIAPTASVLDALKLMAEKDIGALVVLDGERLVGIFSERDYARKVILFGKASKDTSVSEIMTHKVVCVRPEHSAGGKESDRHHFHWRRCPRDDYRSAANHRAARTVHHELTRYALIHAVLQYVSHCLSHRFNCGWMQVAVTDHWQRDRV
jgi:hypothetical protein